MDRYYVSKTPSKEGFHEIHKQGCDCSGLMNPDTNIGGKVTTLIEVPDDQKTTFLYS